MIYHGERWESIGRWAAARGMAATTVRDSVTTGNRVMGEVVHEDKYSGRRIVRAAGVLVLIVPVRGQQWLYLRIDDGGGDINAA